MSKIYFPKKSIGVPIFYSNSNSIWMPSLGTIWSFLAFFFSQKYCSGYFISLTQFWMLYTMWFEIWHQWGFSGLQNQGCRFLQPAEIFPNHAKIFEAHLMNFSKTLNIKCCVKKWVLTKIEKILRLQKFFLIMQKFFAWCCKNHFLQPRKTRLPSSRKVVVNFKCYKASKIMLLK